MKNIIFASDSNESVYGAKTSYIKTVLAETGKTTLAGQTVGCQPRYGIRMVYQHQSTGFIYAL